MESNNLVEQYKDKYIFRNNYTWGISKNNNRISLLPNINIKKKKIPFVVIFKITKQCNLNCKYCYSKKKSNFINLSVIDNLCDEILAYKKPIQLIFHGGEPLLEIEKIKYIIKKLKTKKNIYYSIQTNGVLLDKNIIIFFKKNNVKVCISLDGPKKYHNLYRSNFEDTYNSINLCNNYGLNPSVICVLNELSIKHPKSIFIFFKKLNINRIKFNLISSKEKHYSGEEVLYFYKKIYKLLVKNNLNSKSKFYDVTLSNLTKKLLFNIDVNHCGFSCNAGKQLVAITPNGDIYPCDYFSELEIFKLANIKQFNFNSIPLNKYFNLVYNKNLKSCFNCVFKGFIFCNCISDLYFNKKQNCDFWKQLIYFMMIKIYSDISEISLLLEKD